MKEVFEELVSAMPDWLKVLLTVVLFSALLISFAIVFVTIIALLTS